MKRNYGKWALWGSLLSWAMLIVGVLSMWGLMIIWSAGHNAGGPPVHTPLMGAFGLLAFLSYPMSFASMVLAALGVFKERSVVSAVIGGFLALMLFGFVSFGLWVAAHGGV